MSSSSHLFAFSHCSGATKFPLTGGAGSGPEGRGRWHHIVGIGERRRHDVDLLDRHDHRSA